MTRLADLLRERINTTGPIPVSEFMSLALGHPEQGYYRTRDPLGRAGDFTTAPEISQIFGELIGLWCAAVWQQSGGRTPINLIELGPGRGTMMMDMLRAARSVPEFSDALSIHLVETSPVLKDRQRETLADAATQFPIEWHDDITSLPEGPVLIVANEFFDALPVDQWVKAEKGWRLRCVGLNQKDGFQFVVDDTVTPSSGVIPSSLNGVVETGSIFESSPVGEKIGTELASLLIKDGSAALIIDYGHPRSAIGETLQAVGEHKKQDIFDRPGDIDLTAHVDFEGLGKSMALPGLSVFGPIPQGAFLTALGIEHRTKALISRADSQQAETLRTGTERLIAADAMGTLFKVMAVGRSDAGPLPGFPFAE